MTHAGLTSTLRAVPARLMMSEGSTCDKSLSECLTVTNLSCLGCACVACCNMLRLVLRDV